MNYRALINCAATHRRSLLQRNDLVSMLRSGSWVEKQRERDHEKKEENEREKGIGGKNRRRSDGLDCAVRVD